MINTIPDYEWIELWRALFGLFTFIATKLDGLTTTGGVEQLLQEAIVFLHLALSKSETILPTPLALHQFVYELVRSAPVLQILMSVLDELALPPSKSSRVQRTKPKDLLSEVVTIARYYEARVLRANASTAEAGLQVVVREIENDGLHGVNESQETEPPRRSDDVSGFSRYACMDGLALMP